MLYNAVKRVSEVSMKGFVPLLFLMLLALFAMVLLSRTHCPVCGRPVYLFFLQFCSCK